MSLFVFWEGAINLPRPLLENEPLKSPLRLGLIIFSTSLSYHLLKMKKVSDVLLDVKLDVKLR